MVQKNKGKGGKRHRRGKKNNEPETTSSKTTKIAEGEYEKYGKIINLSGDCRVIVTTTDGTEYVCHIPGKFRKRVWMKMDDIILFAVRPFEENKGDVISVYSPNEVRWLTIKNELPSTFSNIELNDDTPGGQDIVWNRESSSDSFEDDVNMPEEEKAARRAEKAARDAVPAQTNLYEMPSSDSESSEYIPANTNMEELLDAL